MNERKFSSIEMLVEMCRLNIYVISFFAKMSGSRIYFTTQVHYLSKSLSPYGWCIFI